MQCALESPVTLEANVQWSLGVFLLIRKITGTAWRGARPSFFVRFYGFNEVYLTVLNTFGKHTQLQTLCDLVLEHFYHPREATCLLVVAPHPLALAVTSLLSVSMELPFLHILCRSVSEGIITPPFLMS